MIARIKRFFWRRRAVRSTIAYECRQAQWYLIPITIAMLARRVEAKLAEQHIHVPILKLCRLIEKRHKRIARY